MKLLCKNCGGIVGMRVSIKNIFGEIRTKVMTNKVEISFKHLIAKNVIITGENFACLRCGKDVDENSILIHCGYSDRNGSPDDFYIIRGKNKNGKNMNTVLIHKDYVDKFTKDAEKSGYEVQKRKLKLVLNKEIRPNDQDIDA